MIHKSKLLVDIEYDDTLPESCYVASIGNSMVVSGDTLAECLYELGVSMRTLHLYNEKNINEIN